VIASKIYTEASNRLIETIKATPDWTLAKIDQAFDLLLNATRNGSTIFACGNGGSASTSQHFIAELVGRYVAERPGFPAVSLTADTSILTAVGNDYGYGQVFARQVNALGKEGDVLVAFSTSGKSLNVVAALRAAEAKGMRTIMLTGIRGMTRAVSRDADVCIGVQSNETARIQEVHDLIIHVWCQALDEETSRQVP
jgi:D-sedoheptulose 7-phosphate isomerase